MYLGDKPMRALMTKGNARLTEDWDTNDLSTISLWKVPVAKNPKVVRTWTCGGIGFDRRVSLWSCGFSRLHICSITVLGILNCDVSHSSVSARISTRSQNTNKVREVAFKLLHRCYPVKTRLVKYKINIDTYGSFCGNVDETICNLFWDCTYSHVFWIYINNLIKNKLDSYYKLNIQHVLFGLTQNEEWNPVKIINLLLIFAKLHIHCTKFTHQRPNLILFKALWKFLYILKSAKQEGYVKNII